MSKSQKTSKQIEGKVVTPKRKTPKKQSNLARSETSVVAGLGLSTQQLESALEQQTEQRELIANFVKKHLVKGVDFIRIHVVKNCDSEEKRRGSCKNDKHFSKDILAKPGQEKIFSLFQLTSELIKDTETMEMLEKTRGLVAYKCLVKKSDGTVVAEGRGACQVGDNRRDVNATIKIAEKRARMDACLALGFSEYFAQDLDDPDYQTQRKAAEDEAAARDDDGSGLPARDPKLPIDELERMTLAKHLLKRGFDNREEQLELLALNGINEPRTMTSGQARELIVKLKTSSFEVPPKTDTILDDLEDLGEDETEEAVVAAKEAREKAAKTADLEKDPELVVDEELKNMITTRAADLPLNGRGKMWFYRKVCGRPYSAWDKMADDDWRRAFDVIEAIDDGSLEIPGDLVTKNLKPAKAGAKTK